jgi:hypothetical protein
MRSLADRSFSLLFEAIVRQGNAGSSLDSWNANGVSWNRTRHNFAGRHYGFAIEVFIASCPGRNGWSLVVVKEHWWSGRHRDIVKSQYWSKQTSGKRNALMSWLNERKRELVD